MKPPNPKSDRPTGLVPPGAAGDTQVIDLQDVELLVAAQTEAAEQAEHQRSLPPPLPPEIRASHVPSEPPQISQPPGSQAPSFYPQPPAATPPRSTGFYLVALLVFLAVGIGGGLFVAMTLRKAPSAAPTPSAKPQAAVITIPVVEMNDDPDGGAAK
jgi:hypothetical protein